MNNDIVVWYTSFVSPKPLSKAYAIGEDGKIIKTPATAMSNGTAHRMRATWREFAEHLDAAGPGCAFGYGLFPEGYGQTAPVVTRAQGADVSRGEIERTKDFFSYGRKGGVLMLDHDPRESQSVSPADLIKVLAEVIPGAEKAARIVRRSVSSGVRRVEDSEGGDEIGGGFHLYFPVKDASVIPEMSKILIKRLWLNGYGHVGLSASGAMLVRCVIDASVFSPERLDFVGQPVLGEGLKWIGAGTTCEEGEWLELEKMEGLSRREERLYLERIEVAKEEAKPNSVRAAKLWVESKIAEVGEECRERLEKIARGESYVLPPWFKLTFAKKGLGEVTVADVIADAARFDHEPLADPIEGVEYGQRTAMLWANEGGNLVIHSFAHGRTLYTLSGGSGNEGEELEEEAEITLIGGSLPDIVSKAEKAMISRGVPFYQARDLLVRPVHLNAQFDGNLAIPQGTLSLTPVDAVWLREKMTSSAVWVKGEGSSRIRVDCPVDVARTYLSRVGEWKVPPLGGIVPHPTILRDGRILEGGGYDKASTLIVEYRGGARKQMKRKEAVAGMMEPFEEFPFTSEVDRSVVASALLTGIVRKSLRTAPLHAFDASVRGSGKSLLSEVISVILTGLPSPMVNISAKDEETEKRIASLLMRGVTCFTLDNIERPVGDEFLKTLMTNPSLQARILGESRMVELSSDCLVMATGNNLRIKDDFVRRCLMARLDPGCENPEKLRFKRPNLLKWVSENRDRLLWSAIGLLECFYLDGMPVPASVESEPLGSFEDWSNWIRACLVWAGFRDPCGNQTLLEDSDPIKELLRELFPLLWSAQKEGFGGRSMLVRDILGLAAGAGSWGVNNRGAAEQLREALCDLCKVRNEFDRITIKLLSSRLKERDGAVVNGYRLHSLFDGHNKTRTWTVEKLSVDTVGISSGVKGFPIFGKGRGVVENDVPGTGPSPLPT